MDKWINNDSIDLQGQLQLKTPTENIWYYHAERNCLVIVTNSILPTHYSDVRMSVMMSQITGVSMVCWTVWVRIKENINDPHWALWGEFTGHQWIPLTKAQ